MKQAIQLVFTNRDELFQYAAKQRTEAGVYTGYMTASSTATTK